MPTLARKGGVRGLGVLASPNKRIGGSRSSLDSGQRSKPFRSQPFSTYHPTVSGVTRDSTGAPLGGCVVQLFRTSDDLFLGQVFSDGAGAYVLNPIEAGPYYLVAYKPGVPDVAGTTVNTVGAV